MSASQVIDLVSSDDEQIIEILSSSPTSPGDSSPAAVKDTAPQTEVAPSDPEERIDTSSPTNKVRSPNYSAPTLTPPLSTQSSYTYLMGPPKELPQTASVPLTKLSPRVQEGSSASSIKSPSPKKEGTPYHVPFSSSSKSEDFFKAKPIMLQLSDSDDELPPLVIPKKAVVSDDCVSSLSGDDDFDFGAQKPSDLPPAQRKRSCSITPPPEYYPAYKAIRTARSRAFSPEQVMAPQPDPSLEIPDLDPEFQAIMREKENSQLSFKKDVAKEEVKCKIRCNFPKVDGLEITTPKFHKPIEFTTKLSDTFEQMFQYICSNKTIKADELVVEYKGVKLYPRSTPSKLGITNIFTQFDVFTLEAHKLLIEKRMLAEKIRISGDLSDFSSPESEEEVNFITISVRFPKSKDNVETFQLKGSTKIIRILESLREKRGIAPETAIRLEFDGETLDPELTVEAAELEDEDMLDFHA